MSEIKAVPVDRFNGSPLVPTGNPMLDGVGPASWANRTFSVAKGDPDPRGLPVYAADKVVAGTVVELWVDRAEPQVRYYEVKLSNGERRIMLPAGFVQWPNFGLWGNDRLLVKAITSTQFLDVPAIKRDDVITLLEEDKVMAYFAGGHLYATAARSEPII